MAGASQAPLDAVLLPDPAGPPPRPWRTWLFAGCAFVLFVLCSGVGLWAVGRLTNLGLAGRGRAGSLITNWETPAERLTNIASGMNAPTQNCTSGELRELSRFFNRLVAALAQDDDAAFREQVDLNAFAFRASLHPQALSDDDFDRLGMEEQLEYNLECPDGFSSFSVVHVSRGTVAGESVVYVVLSGDAVEATPFRFWLERRGRTWKICDWENFDYGRSEAARWADSYALAGDPQRGGKWAFSTSLQRAYEKMEVGDLAGAAVDLRAAEQQLSSLQVTDLQHVDLASAWLHCRQSEMALKALEGIREPETIADVPGIRARAYAVLERDAESLAAAQEYRQLAGCHPGLLRIEAVGLEAQGQRAAAAECWRQLLRLMPDDYEALSEFCRLADPTRRSEVNDVLARLRKPVDRALEMGLRAATANEEATATTLLAYLESAAPASPAIPHLRAAMLDGQEKYAEAAPLHWQARQLETRPEQRERLLHEYLSSMAYGKRTVEGYQAAEDPQAAFEYLTSGYEDGEAIVDEQDELAALVAAHRVRNPDDAQLEYFAGLLLLREGKFAEAEAFFAAGMKKTTDEELGNRLRSRHREAHYLQGEIQAAYQLGGSDPAATFRELAWLAVGRRDWQKLGELLEMHRSAEPSDPWLDYFSALREQAQGNKATALAAAAKAQALGDEHLKSLCQSLSAEIHIESNDVAQAYATGGEPSATFVRLASQLAEAGEWKQLLELAKLHRAALPGDATALYYATKARWHLGEHEQLVQNLTPWPAGQWQTGDRVLATEAADYAVQSWLRLGNLEQARSAAMTIDSAHQFKLPLVSVELAAGDDAALTKLLDDPTLCRELFDRQLHPHRELARLLTEPRFADLRKRYPQRRPGDYGSDGDSIVLLLNQPLDPARLPAEFELVLGPLDQATRRSLPGAAGDRGRVSYLADLNRATLVVTASPQPYCTEEVFADQVSADHPLHDVIARHAAWVAIDLLPADQHADSEPLAKAAGQLVAAFGDEHAAAIYFERSRGNLHRMAVLDGDLRESLSGGSLPGAAVLRQWEEIFLYESSPDDEVAEEPTWAERRKLLRQLADAARVENAAGHGEVCMHLSRGHAAEALWLKVVRSRRTDTLRDEFIGEVTADSQLWPHLKAGERLRIALYEAQETRPLQAEQPLEAKQPPQTE